MRRIADKDTEAVADAVIEPAILDVELDVPRLLLRAPLVQEPAAHKGGHYRPLAGVAGCLSRACEYGRRRRGGRHLGGAAVGGLAVGAVELGVQRLQHALRLLAAGHAEVEPLLLRKNQRIGVFLAGVAALAAVLLRHRRHQPPPERSALRQLHPLGERDGRIVPGRLAVIAVGKRIGRLGQGRSHGPHRRGGGRKRGSARSGHTVQAEQAGKEAVQPSPLFGRERRVLGNERSQHHVSSAANRVFNASMEWRVVNAWKLSAGLSR